jgi:hypothetical protein
MTGDPELADDEHVEGQIEDASDFRRDGNATAREGQRDDILVIRVDGQEGREMPAAVGPVMESHGRFMDLSYLSVSTNIQAIRRAISWS